MARNLRHRRRGMALVEAALVLPLLVLIVFGGLEYGMLFFKAQLLNNAARHGARKAILADATSGEVYGAVNELMTAGGVSGHTTAITPGVDAATGATVTVTVSIATASLRIPHISILPMPQHLQASVSMAKEG
jgi:Flp pilus assembly protein TadG